MAMPNPRADLAPVASDPGTIMEEVVAKGDLKLLTAEQRATYYTNVCKSMGLNPFTAPFQYITLNGKLTLYATRTAADQLRKLNGVDVLAVEREIVDDLIVVTVRVRDRDGRTDEEVGAVSFGGLKGEAKANAIMKAITKAKRRATLSICGLGWLDETEVETVPSARAATVDLETGEITEPATLPEPPRRPARLSEMRAQQAQQAQQAQPAAQVELVDPAEDRERANRRAHAVANGIYGDKGHDVLHILAEIGNKGSLNDCTAEQLDGMATRLEALASDPQALDEWHAKWIAPRLPAEGN